MVTHQWRLIHTLSGISDVADTTLSVAPPVRRLCHVGDTDTDTVTSDVLCSQVFDDDTSITLSNPRPMSVGVYKSVSSMLNKSRTSCGFGVNTLSEGKHTGALALSGVKPVLGMMTSSQSETSMLMWLLSTSSVSTIVLRFGSDPWMLPWSDSLDCGTVNMSITDCLLLPPSGPSVPVKSSS